MENFQDCVRNIHKNVVKRGEISRKASDGSVCCVVFKNISGRNYQHSLHLMSTTSTITIGAGYETIDQIIEYCIETMTVSEESEFSIDSPDFDLKFHAILDSCFFKPYSFQMSDVEKLALARTFKEQGVELFKKKKIVFAFRKFGRALQYILVMSVHYPTEDDHGGSADENYLKEVSDLLVNIYNNLALCQLQYKNFDAVIQLGSKSLLIQPNVKAFYRRAVAFIAKIQYEDAEQDLLEALKLDASNKAALEKLNLVRELDKTSLENYKETVKKMFS